MNKRQQYKKLYDSKTWIVMRDQVRLRSHQLCEPCERRGLTIPGVEVHHLDGHDGDPARFYCSLDRLENQCKKCHLEAHGKRMVTIGNDGWPIERVGLTNTTGVGAAPNEIRSLATVSRSISLGVSHREVNSRTGQ